jgi:predicted lipoprotein
MHKFISILLTFIFLFFISENCSKNNSKPSQESAVAGGIFNIIKIFNPTPIFSNLSNNVILNSYSNLEATAKTLKAATDGYTQNCSSNTSLQNLQTLWRANVISLKETEITQFGPAVQGGYYEIMDPWVNSYLSNPPDTTSINAYITGAGVISLSTISALNKLQRGMPAIEYLLFDDGAGNSSLSSICTSLSGRRLQFLVQLATDYYNNANAMKAAWISSSGNFVNELPTAGMGSSFFDSKKSAMDTLINQMILVLNTIVDKKLGYPAGLNVSSNGIIRSNNVESRYSDASVDNLLANLRSIRNYYTGNGGAGISDYVKDINPILDRKILTQIEDAISKTQAISNLRTSLATSNLTSAKSAFDSIRTLRTTLTTELTSISGTGAVGSTGDGD